MNLMTCQTYREFIQFKLKENSSSRGYKTRLARALKVQASYFSHILGGSAELSLDQAAALCDFWHLDSISSDYFLTLVSLSRAGTDALKRRLALRLESIKNEAHFYPNLQIAGVEMEFQTAIDYFSHWYHCAIHASLNIKSLRTAEKLAKKLQMPVAVVQRSLNFLEESKLITRENDEYVVLKPTLTTTKPVLKNLFYSESRKKAGETASLANPDGVHFSMVCTLSASDYEKMAAMIRDFAKKTVDSVGNTEEEDVAYFLIDWFRLGR